MATPVEVPPAVKTSPKPAPPSYLAAVWARARAMLGARKLSQEDIYPDAVLSTRGIVFAEALLLLLLGFALDDLRVLRLPGFLVGVIGAAVVLSFGGLYHGANVARRLRGLPPDEVRAGLRRSRSTGRFAAFVVGAIFFLWLVMFSRGVPPWA